MVLVGSVEVAVVMIGRDCCSHYGDVEDLCLLW